ncbi:hypothetical protein A5746_21065 [Mycolicibacterium conceptionense]|nr:hypothetical protein A5639_17070 [Mycolicibacterium conceptionense]OMB88660.1 hypothetical protein A5741_14495 [Mycolicibacterium conceptionense]OMB90749.1 hypothetical protein A5746_21065 [Mycolicibacterium conceptionense]
MSERLPDRTAHLTLRRRTEVIIGEVWAAISSPPSMAALEILSCTRRTRAAAINSELAAI